jgi:hypothetical protein
MKWLLLLLMERVLAWELTLLHVNDIHVRMEETNKYSAACRSALNHPQYFSSDRSENSNP